MHHWVALLRGVNLGGHKMVPMADLRALCAGLGWGGVQSYIASGNLVFAAAGTGEALARRLELALAAQMGVQVAVLVLAKAGLQAALAACPFDPLQGSHVHGFFLWADPVVRWPVFDALRLPNEALVVQGRVAWLHAPGGIGRSRLAENLHQVVTGTQMTARNLNTLRKLVEMLDGVGRV